MPRGPETQTKFVCWGKACFYRLVISYISFCIRNGLRRSRSSCFCRYPQNYLFGRDGIDAASDQADDGGNIGIKQRRDNESDRGGREPVIAVVSQIEPQPSPRPTSGKRDKAAAIKYFLLPGFID